MCAYFLAYYISLLLQKLLAINIEEQIFHINYYNYVVQILTIFFLNPFFVVCQIYNKILFTEDDL